MSPNGHSTNNLIQIFSKNDLNLKNIYIQGEVLLDRPWAGGGGCQM